MRRPKRNNPVQTFVTDEMLKLIEADMVEAETPRSSVVYRILRKHYIDRGLLKAPKPATLPSTDEATED